MDSLDDSQRRALAQLQEIIGSSDQEVAVSVLSSVDWDVHRAAELIFGNQSSSSHSPPVEHFDVDDSHQGHIHDDVHDLDDTRHRPTQVPFPLARPLYTLITFPFNILSSLFRFIFGVLRIPFPPFRFGLGLYRPSSRPHTSTRRGPDRWLRELEEETGAVSIARCPSLGAKATTSSLNVDPSHDSSSSSLTSRAAAANGGTDDSSRKYLPDFTISTYEEFLRTCQRDAKIGCVILVSDEHDDVSEFKRSTLTNYTFAKTLYDNDILVWGGDVRDREAWTASEKLQATTYPFVAFLALQPRRNPSAPSSSSHTSHTSPPSLTVLSRHQGPPTPTSTAPTSPTTLTTHLTHQLLPRIQPYLTRLTSLQRTRELERHLRAEQDRAFQTSAKRDKERIEAKIAAEQREREERKRAEMEERRMKEERRREEECSRKREEERMVWRRWTRRMMLSLPLLASDTTTTTTTTANTTKLRIAIRLPNGTRVVHSFPPTATLTSLYAFVDTQLIPPTLPSSEDPHSIPTPTTSTTNVNQHPETDFQTALEAHIASFSSSKNTPTPTPSVVDYWGFTISLAYPRLELPWKPGSGNGHKLSDITQLTGGGQVVVEMIRPPVSSVSSSSSAVAAPSSQKQNGNDDDDDDDGYRTEDSNE